MDRRGLLVGSLAVGTAALLPAVAMASPEDQWLEKAIHLVRYINVPYGWVQEMKNLWDIDVNEEAQKTLFEFPEHVHVIIKDKVWVDGSGFRRIHMTWTLDPMKKPNTFWLHSEGYVESFTYTDQGPVLVQEHKARSGASYTSINNH